MNNPKTIAVISYITWIGWVAAFVTRDENDHFQTHHINQSLIINLISLAGSAIWVIPDLPMKAKLRGVVWCATFVLWLIGIVRAAKGSTESFPLIGDLHIIS